MTGVQTCALPIFSRLKRSGRAYARVMARAERLKERGKTFGGARQSPEEARELLSHFYSAMDDDVDTPKALEWVEKELIGSSSSDAARRYSALRIVSEVLGVHFAKP